MPEDKTCPVCGETFTPPPTRPKQIYCGRPCSVIGRTSTKEEAAKKRVDKFIDDLLNVQILDALEGKLEVGTNNRMTVTGARAWENEKFIVLVVKRD